MAPSINILRGGGGGDGHLSADPKLNVCVCVFPAQIWFTRNSLCNDR